MILLPVLLRYNYDERLHHDPVSVSFLRLELILDVFWIITFYFNALVLTPQLVYRKKYFLYLFLQLLIFGLILVVHAALFRALLPPPTRYNPAFAILINLPAFIVTVAVSLAFKVLYDKSRDEEREKEKRAENLSTELSFLRSQISPHFVFNILNNITAMARLKSDDLEPTIIRLSSLLRYMVYDASLEKVPLQTEIEYLQSYIDLQKQRFGAKVTVVTELITVVGSHEIEPTLLIPFVENAFKHGLAFIKHPEIRISLTLEKNMLRFSVKNKYNADTEEIKDKTSGIGLSNVKRRLALLYQHEHELHILKEDGWFTATLQVNLH